MKTTTTLKTALILFTATILGFSASAKSPVNPSTPADHSAFSATFNDIKADLKWTATTEGKVSHFVVERSNDGVNFQDAAVVFAFENGNNAFTYKFSDKLNNANGVVYYRLCTVDNNGTYSYSDIQVVRTAH